MTAMASLLRSLTHPIHCCHLNVLKLAFPALLRQKQFVLPWRLRALWLAHLPEFMKVTLHCGCLYMYVHHLC